MAYLVVIEKAGDGFSAYVPDLPGCIATGETREKARQMIASAIEMHLEGMRADGLPIPEASASAEVVEVA